MGIVRQSSRNPWTTLPEPVQLRAMSLAKAIGHRR